MKIGDLVSLKMRETQPPQIPSHGIVLNTWRNHKNKILEVEVMWGGVSAAGIARYRADLFEVLK